jgi:hypothetical protein
MAQHHPQTFEALYADGVLSWVGGRHPIGHVRLKVTVMEPKTEAGVGAIKPFPSPRFPGHGKTIGDLIEPLVREQEWECLG